MYMSALPSICTKSDTETCISAHVETALVMVAEVFEAIVVGRARR
eukprot:gene9480-1722_t